MSRDGANKDKYTGQRRKVETPYVPIKGLRIAAELSLEELIAKIKVVTDREYTKGAISGVENGHRGASPDLLSALERVYKLPPGFISTTYKPRSRSNSEEAA